MSGIDFKSLDNILLQHAKRLIEEARRLRSEKISYRVLIKEYKPKWEREAYMLVKKHLENVALLGKDSGFIGDPNAEWFCICDLLDGSLNFMCGLKYFAYSLALAHQNEIVYGVVIDLDDMSYYRAERGGGAYLVKPNKNSYDLKEAALEIPANYKAITTNVTVKNINSIQLRCSALELCLLAMGVAEIGIGRTWTPEMAAGYIIARETGLKFADWNFKPLNEIPLSYREIQYVVGSPKTLAELHAKVNSIKELLVNT